MAMFLNELDFVEQELITRAMLYSGQVLDFPEVEVPIADKHSTGGVGDKTSLLIAPIAAACGVAVPMISGRGLGHTGGTLDKLESIPGYNVNLPVGQFKRVVAECGYAMNGQTAEIAPADKRIYALRDATATVPTIPLIVASIMSKKLAEGLDALVLDVKTGNGAFMKDLDSSRRLASEMVKTGRAFGVNTRALITDMGQPLGEYVGNALEVYECLKLLKGEGTPGMERTLVLSRELTAHMLVCAGIADAHDKALKLVSEAVESGRAFQKFKKNVELQGGDTAFCDRPDLLLGPDLVRRDVFASGGGFVASIDTFSVGRIVSDLGGGRVRAEDGIDHAVGFRSAAQLSSRVEPGQLLGTIFARSDAAAGSAGEKLLSAYTIADTQPPEPELIVEVVK